MNTAEVWKAGLVASRDAVVLDAVLLDAVRRAERATLRPLPAVRRPVHCAQTTDRMLRCPELALLLFWEQPDGVRAAPVRQRLRQRPQAFPTLRLDQQARAPRDLQHGGDGAQEPQKPVLVPAVSAREQWHRGDGAPEPRPGSWLGLSSLFPTAL